MALHRNSHTSASIAPRSIPTMTNSWGFLYDGVNSSVPRNAGPECANYLTSKRHWIEGATMISLCVIVFRWAFLRARPLRCDDLMADGAATPMATGKKVLLIAMTFTLGLELGFKLSARSVVYILNPCHITTVMQVIPCSYFFLN